MKKNHFTRLFGGRAEKFMRIMKISVFLMVLFTLSVSAGSYAQNQKFSIKMQNASVKEIIDVVEKQSDFYFFFKSEEDALNKKLDVEFKSSTVDQVLDEILDGSGLSYKVVDKYIAITSEKVLQQQQQNKKVFKGTVRDGSGETIPGVSVTEVGTTNGVVTNLNGEYVIHVSGTELLFSFIGMKNKTITLGAESVRDVVLTEDIAGLDEVVVVGFGTQKKANLTGAVSSVKMKEVLGDRPVNSVSSALQGAVAGLNVVQNSGTPGGGVSLNIRGFTSINGGEPLVLVDNVPMDISMVDPNDVESVSVLKDAASSSIYGARAAYGVILVTTKKAKFNQNMRVNYNNNFSFSRPESLPQKSGIRETIKIARLFAETEGNVLYFPDLDPDIWERELDKYEADPSQFPNGFSDVDGTLYSLKEYDAFEDMMSSYGYRQSHNVSINGGTDKLSYRMGAGTLNEDGILVTDKDSYKRNNISVYVKTKVSKWFTAEVDFKYVNSKTSNPSNSNIWKLAALFPSHVPYGSYEKDGVTTPYQTSRNYLELDGTNNSRKDNIRLFGKTTMKPFKGFTLVSEWTYNYRSSKTENYKKSFVSVSPRTFVKQVSRDNSIYSRSDALVDYKALNLYANYKVEVSGVKVGLMAGFNQEEENYSYLSAEATKMLNDETPSITNGLEPVIASDSDYDFTTRGSFFRTNLSYKNRYLLEINGRYDLSSRFPSKTRGGFFPSFSAGWRVSEESFMKSIKDIVSNLKFRASYGSIGNQNIQNYGFIPKMKTYDTGWMVGDAKGKTLYAPKLVRTDFTWEKVVTTNFGLDFGLLNNRFSTTLDVYKRETIGMVSREKDLPAVIGTDAPDQNVADLETLGWELQVNWNDRVGKDIRYNIGLNLFDSQSEITKYDNPSGSFNNYRVGEKIGEIWGYTFDRFMTADDFEANGTKLKDNVPYVPGVSHKEGDIVYIDRNGDGVINQGDDTETNPGDRTVIGNNTRRYNYGITAGFGWKNFDISMYFTGVAKRDLWMTGDFIFPHNSRYSTIYTNNTDYWTPENRDAHFGRPRYTSSNNKLVQDRFLQNGAYIRLRNLSISYKIPKEILKKINVNSFSIFMAGENLWTKHHLAEGMDPERIGGGWSYPFMRKFSFGVKIGF